MSSELPIACTLSGPDLAERLREMNDLGRSALLEVERNGARGRAVLRFERDDETAERLRAIVAAEARCCAFLDMTVRAGADALALTIDAPDDAALVVDELVRAFSARSA